MSCFHLLEHTADIGIEAIADRREGLPEQSAYGLRMILFGELEARPCDNRQVFANGNSSEETLVNWLNELLYLMETKRFLPARVDISIFSDTEISASVAGEKIDPSEHPLRCEVKGVTHHQTLVDHARTGWRARIFLDL